MHRLVAVIITLIAAASPAFGEKNSDVPLFRVRLGAQDTVLDGTSYGGFQMGLQLHPTIGKAGSPHLNRLFVAAQLAASLG